jgi:endonuclease YncB( thermonuclease family)
VHLQTLSSIREFVFAGGMRRLVQLSLCLLALAVMFVPSQDLSAQSSQASRIFEGHARIIDGDTLEIGTQRIDLYGIDAPEPDQHCERDVRQWRCGMEATYGMAALIENHWVTCHEQASGTVGNSAVNPLAVCRMGGPKGIVVNQRTILRGWALALRPSGDDYVGAEQQAKAAKLGIWSGTFVAPWEWRRTRETGKTVN